MSQLEQFQLAVSQAKRMVFFGGAGVSTESGIPDFRSVDGLYHQRYDCPPETILSHPYFVQHTEAFFRFYREKMLYLDAQPNAAHKQLAAWEQAGKLSAVITQNIDGLHQKAGSKNVLELHGSVLRNYCVKCGAFYGVDAIAACDGVPRCCSQTPHGVCGGVIKPDVVLYEESLDETVMQRAIAEIAAADLLIVGGTSLAVYPAAGFLRFFRGQHLVLINRDATPLDARADLVLHERIGEVFQMFSAHEMTKE